MAELSLSGSVKLVLLHRCSSLMRHVAATTRLPELPTLQSLSNIGLKADTQKHRVRTLQSIHRDRHALPSASYQAGLVRETS